MANWIGTNVPRKEGVEKLTGSSLYVDDLSVKGMIYGATVRSTVARAKIKNIHFKAGVPWHEFTIVTAKDIPGKNVVALILDDQPLLADGVVNHPEEPIVLLAHSDRELLRKAVLLVQIEYEAMPAVFALEESLAKRKIIWGKDNTFRDFKIQKGDVDAAFKNAAHIIEGEYFTGAQEQLYIEPNGMIATFSEKTGVAVRGSLQCPYYIQKALKTIFNLPDSKVQVIQMETGGGFGGKEEYPSMIAGHAALLAMKAQKPVKLIYDRAEDMLCTTKRHPSRTKHRTAVDKNGKLLAMDIDFALDGGAYATLSAVVLSRGAIHAAGPYDCPNVRIHARAVATNMVPHGAFRGFGAPQSVFAMERQMDLIAKKLKKTPDGFRKINFLETGKTTATSQVIREKINMNHLMDLAFKKSSYAKKRKEFEKFNRKSKTLKRGIGFATFMHGAGFTGSGEVKLASEAGVEIDAQGQLRVLAASTEIGQGTNTIFAQIAADVFKVSPSDIQVARPDTHVVPDSGPTVASRTVMVVGKLVENASKELRAKLEKAKIITNKSSGNAVLAGCKKYAKSRGAIKEIARFQKPKNIVWDDETYCGDAYATYAWACYVACVSIDLVTYQITVDDFVAVQEAGNIVHPLLAEGQIEGGVAQGIGFCLLENVKYKEGRMQNANMTNYIVPTSKDTPPIRVFFIEKSGEHGPGKGAKGIGELPLDGTAPAIANAIEFATGVSVDSIPFTPEMLMNAWMNQKEVKH